MNDEPTQQQNVAQLVERLSNEMNAARAEMSKIAALSRRTRRRDFTAGLVGAVAWPLVAHAQQPERMRRIGVLMMGFSEGDPEWKRLEFHSADNIGRRGPGNNELSVVFGLGLQFR